MHRIECPKCQHKLKYADEHAGKKAKCQKCGHSFRLPDAADNVEPVAVPQPPKKSAPVVPPRPAYLPPLVEPPEVKSHRGRSGVRYTESKSLLSAMGGHFRSDRLACLYTISPDGWRVFHSGSDVGFWGAIGMMADGLAMQMLDGKPFKPSHGYIAASLVFSPDSRHYAYVANATDGSFLVLDGVEASERFNEVRDIVLSDAATGVAFAAQRGRRWHVVHNRRLGPAFDAIHEKSLSISRDGRLAFYTGIRGKQTYVVVGDEERAVSGQEADAISPDGLHRARIENLDRGVCVVTDGRHGSSFEEIAETSLRFSADGTRLAYIAKKGKNWHVVLDGESGPGYADIDPNSLIFSPDGRRFGYVACSERSWWSGRSDWRAVIDGVEQPIYPGVKMLRFSQDGSRVGYAATDKKGTSLILDERPEGCWGDVSDLTFGPDAKRYACVVTDSRSGMEGLVIDGRECPRYSQLELHGFTLDGGRVVATAFGIRHAEPTDNWPDAQDRGGFLVIDDDYESRAWVSTQSPGPPDPNLFQVVRVGCSGPRSVYTVSVFINARQVYFERLDVACP